MANGDPLEITITPSPCPWGFNPDNRAPTWAEGVQHDLCEIGAVLTGRMSAGDYISEVLDDLWAGLDAIWQAIKSGAQWTLEQTIEIFQPLWEGINQVWEWLERSAGPWVIAGGVLLLAIAFAPSSRSHR